MKTLLLIILLLNFPSTLHAITPAELAVQAQAAYTRGDYAAAVQNWKTLSEIGFINGDLYNNIGNAYWRDGKVGLARLNFLKAQSLSPRSREIRANLDYIENPTSPSETLTGPTRILSKLPFYSLNLNRFESLWLTATAGLLLFSCLYLARRLSKVYLRWLALIFLVPWLWGGVQLSRNYYLAWGQRPGILIVPEADLLAHPVPGGPALQKLSEGSEIHLIKKQGDFFQVKTLEGKKGWLPKQSVGEGG